MKRSAVITLCVILGLFAGISSATGVTLLGPNQYIRTSGAPNIYNDSFDGIPGEGMLIVKNGAIDGADRITDAISSASIYVNGEQIFGPNDFNKNVYLLQAPVNLTENNSITIELASNPGSYLTIEITEEVDLPTVSLSVDPETMQVGESSTLTWTSTNSDSCVIDNGIGDVSLNGSISVAPTETTTYTITATGPSGTVTASVTVTVMHPPASVSIIADPETIQAGESSTLTWTSTNSDSCIIDNGIGDVPLNGSISVSPAETTTYTITATGLGGSTNASVTITVNNTSPPQVNISPNPSSIEPGQSSTLTWTSTNAQHAFIDNGVGAVPVNGSITVYPEHTTTYTISVTGPNGSNSSQVKIHITGNPAPLPDGSFGQQYADLVPADATVDEYDTKRFSLITGLVHSIDDSPLADVSVTLYGHPEYGTVLTNAQGQFSIPVEGGTTLTVIYQKDGYITSHRKVYVPWNNIAITETIQMIAQDPVATIVTFNGNPDTIMTHQSTEISDEFGNRSATMVFAGDNQAYLVDENGNDIHELTTIVTRATEFTTPDSMPAKLPPNSAYTYCTELSVDGAQRVRFEKPVTVWVDNFLGFDVGEIVPVGYYDRDRGIWVPSDNGVVVKLLDTDGDDIVDSLDADGDNQPDDLDGDGTFQSEVVGLENPSIYEPEATFWRLSVTHFTPWDCNWPYGLPPDTISPNPNGEPDADQENADFNPCNNPIGSYVSHRSRVLHDDISIPGTDLTLHYASDRIEDHKKRITVPVSGSDLPDSLKRIIVQVIIAGQTYEKILDPLPNQIEEFFWDGRDYLGNQVHSSMKAKIKIGFVYDAYYYSSRDDLIQSFAQAGKYILEVKGRQELVTWKLNTIEVNNNIVSTIADGWTVSNHHALNPVNPKILIKGDGSTERSVDDIIDTIVGTGNYGSSGDGGAATDAEISGNCNIATDAEGNLYIADYDYSVIRRLDQNGIITAFAGTGVKGDSGDGGPALEADISPWDIEVNAQGNVYFTSINCVRKIDQNGIISTVAGTGIGGYSGDGGPAMEAEIQASSIALDKDGNLYICGGYRIRKVDTNGVITTIAGTGERGFSGDGGPAVNAQFNGYNISSDRSGNIYIADRNNYRIRMIDRSGTITTLAGTGNPGVSGDGGPASQAELFYVNELAFDALGNMYIHDSNFYHIRMINTAGIIDTVAGNGNYTWTPFTGDGGSATNAEFGGINDIATDPEGNLIIVEWNNRIVRKVFRYELGLQEEGYIIFKENSGKGHRFSKDGKHISTIDLTTNIVTISFTYDESGHLISFADQFGNETTVQRNMDGIPTAIISPDNITTALTIDEDGHLTRITYPDGNYYEFEYTSDGLMTAKVEPEGNRFEHLFDSYGRLTDAFDQENGHWVYTKIASESGDTLTAVETGEGNTTSYLDHRYSTGEYISTITDPTGAETLFTQSADGLTVNKSLPCGMDLNFTYDIDSQNTYKYVKEMTELTPSGLERINQREKTYEDTDADQKPDLIAETIMINSKTTTLEHDVLQSKKTITSPEGRIVTTFYDPDTLLSTKLATPGLYDTDYDYDSRGRLISINTNTRETTFSYNSKGFLDSTTDPENHITTYIYDPVGRVTAVHQPDTSDLFFEYDANGNMTVLTNPVSIDHVFGFNNVNLQDQYQTPISGNYSYFFDKDRRLIQKTFPSGKQINNIYDTTQLIQIQTPEGNVDFTYLCGSKVGSVSKGLESINYAYDGKLLTSESLSGSINQSLQYTYNDDFNVTNFSYSGDTESYTYDNDGLLTGSGDYTITRNAQNGLPESVSGGSLSLSRNFNGYGELDSQITAVNSQNVVQWDLTRDNNGRITQKDETINGATSTFVYSYDSMGRLLSVTKDSVLVEQYQYDLNGTRESDSNTLRGIAGRSMSYSDEDHLLTAGNVTYNYDLDGFLTTKTSGSDITSYTYSIRGELLNVILPDGTLIEYIHDPLGRRIAKKINGTTVEKYLWQGLTRLLAVYDGSDNLLMRFEYADGRMPVSMNRIDGIHYLVYDQVGSLRVVADWNGNPIKTIDYDSFGNIINDTDPSFAVPFGFAGGLHDSETGLLRFGYRDYDPDVGRWTAKDPILFKGGDTDLYGYCLNDPVNSIDLIGLKNWDMVTTVGLAAIGVAAGLTGGAAVAFTLVTAIPTIFIDPAPLNVGDDEWVRQQRFEIEINELNEEIDKIRRDMEPMLQKLHIAYEWDPFYCYDKYNEVKPCN